MSKTFRFAQDRGGRHKTLGALRSTDGPREIWGRGTRVFQDFF